MQELERDLEVYKREANELRKQLGNQQQEKKYKQEQDNTNEIQLALKNKEIENYINEIEQLSQSNAQLEEQLENTVQELKELQEQAEQDINNMSVSQRQTLDLQKYCENIEVDKEKLEIQVEKLKEQLVEAQQLQETMVSQFNEKLEVWRIGVKERDEIIINKDIQLNNIQQQLNLMKREDETLEEYDNTVDGMKKAIIDRDLLIGNLRSQLQTIEYDFELLSEELVKMEKTTNVKLKTATIGGREESNRILKEKSELHKLLSNEKNKNKEKEVIIEEYQNEINELNMKVTKYEKGFGIDNVFQELKNEKLQVKIRDKEIVDLNKQISILSLQFSDILYENETLRKTCGITNEDKIDTSKLKIKDKLEIEQLKSLNKQYETEIKQLEEERIQLKSQMRLNAINQGEKAMKLGLSHDQVIQLENYALTLKQQNSSNKGIDIVTTSSKLNEKSDERDTAKLKKRIDILQLEKEELIEKLKAQQRIDQLIIPLNFQLEKLKQFIQQNTIKVPQDINFILQSESINEDQLFKNDSNISNNNNTNNSFIIKELINEVKKLSMELTTKNNVNNMRNNNKWTNNDKEITNEISANITELMKEHNNNEYIIVCLNNQLIETIEELKKKEKRNEELDKKINKYETTYEKIKEQQELLIKEYQSEKMKWNKMYKEQDNRNKELTNRIEELQIKYRIVDDNLIKMSRSPEEIKQQIAQSTQEIIVMKTNEIKLTRKCDNLQDEINLSLKLINKIKEEYITMETTLQQRINELEYYNNNLHSSIAKYQELNDKTVSIDDYNIINIKFNHLYEKHANLLEREQQRIVEYDSKDKIISDLNEIKNKYEQLEIQNKEQIAKNKVLEQFIQEMKFRPEINVMANKILSLEISETNAKVMVEVTSKQIKTMLETQQSLQFRIQQLENQVIELTTNKHNLMEQIVQYQTQYQGCLDKEVSNKLQIELIEIQEQNEQLKGEVKKYQELYEIVSNQMFAIKNKKEIKNQEMEEYRNAIREIQSNTDTQSVIGRLHRELIASKINENTSLKKQEQLILQINKLTISERNIHRLLELKIDQLLHLKNEYRSKLRKYQLKNNEKSHINSYIQKSEQYLITIRKLQHSNVQLQHQLLVIRNENLEFQNKIDELNFQIKSSNITNNNTNNITSNNEITSEWKVSEGRYKREIKHYKEREEYLMKMNEENSDTIKTLEEQILENEKENNNELELLREKINQLENEISNKENDKEIMQLIEINKVLTNVTDDSKPIAERLKESIQIIEQKEMEINRIKEEEKTAKEQLNKTKQIIEDLETLLLNKNVEIQNYQIQINTKIPIMNNNGEDKTIYTANDIQLLTNLYQNAQDEIQRLEQLNDRKEKTIIKYQNTIQAIRNEHADELHKLKEQITQMNDQLYKETNSTIVNMKQHLEKSLLVDDININNNNNSLNQNVELTVTINEMDKMLLQKETIIRDITNELNVTKRELIESKQIIVNKQEEYSILINQTSVQLNEKEEQIKLTIQQYQHKVENLERTIEENMTQYNENIKQIRIECEQQYQPIISEKEDTIIELQKELNKLKSYKEEMEEYNNNNYSNNNSSYSGTKKEIEQTGMAPRVLAQLNKKYKIQINAKDKQIKTMEEAIGLIKKEAMDAYEKGINKHKQDLAEKPLDKQQYEDDINKLQRKVNSLEDTKSKLQIQLEEAKNKVNTMTNESKTEKERYDSFVNKINNELKKTQKQYSALKAKYERTIQETETYKINNESYKETIANYDKKLKLLSERKHKASNNMNNSNNNKEMNDKNKEMNNIGTFKKHDSVDSLNRTSNASIKELLKEKENKIIELEFINNENNKKKEQLENELSQLKENIKNLEELIKLSKGPVDNDDKNEWFTNWESLKNSMLNLNEQLIIKDSNITQLETQINKLKDQIETETNNNNQLQQEEINKLKKKETEYIAVIEELQGIVDKLKGDNTSLKRNDSSKEIKILKKQIAELEDKLNKEQVNKEIMSQMTQLEENYNKQRKVVLDLSKENEKIEKEMAETQTRFTAIESKYIKEQSKYKETIGLLEYKLNSQENDIHRRDMVIADLKNQLALSKKPSYRGY